MLLLFFAQSDGIAQSANDPSGAFQSSGTFHGASWLDRKVIFRSAACFLASLRIILRRYLSLGLLGTIFPKYILTARFF